MSDEMRAVLAILAAQLFLQFIMVLVYIWHGGPTVYVNVSEIVSDDDDDDDGDEDFTPPVVPSEPVAADGPDVPFATIPEDDWWQHGKRPPWERE